MFWWKKISSVYYWSKLVWSSDAEPKELKTTWAPSATTRAYFKLNSDLKNSVSWWADAVVPSTDYSFSSNWFELYNWWITLPFVFAERKDVTISFWVKWVRSSTNQSLLWFYSNNFSKSHNVFNDSIIDIESVNSDGSVLHRPIFNPLKQSNSEEKSKVIADIIKKPFVPWYWHHIVFIMNYNQNKMFWYFDGELVYTKDTPREFYFSKLGPTVWWTQGFLPWAAWKNFFSWSIQELIVDLTPRSDDDVKRYYKESSRRFRSSKKNKTELTPDPNWFRLWVVSKSYIPKNLWWTDVSIVNSNKIKVHETRWWYIWARVFFWMQEWIILNKDVNPETISFWLYDSLRNWWDSIVGHETSYCSSLDWAFRAIFANLETYKGGWHYSYWYASWSAGPTIRFIPPEWYCSWHNIHHFCLTHQWSHVYVFYDGCIIHKMNYVPMAVWKFLENIIPALEWHRSIYCFDPILDTRPWWATEVSDYYMSTRADIAAWSFILPEDEETEELRASHIPFWLQESTARPKHKQFVWSSADIPYEVTFAKWVNPDVIDLSFTLESVSSDQNHEQMHLCSISFKWVGWNWYQEIDVLTDSYRVSVVSQWSPLDDNQIKEISLTNGFYNMNVYMDPKHKVFLIHVNWDLIYSASGNTDWQSVSSSTLDNFTVRVWWSSLSNWSILSRGFSWRIFGIHLNHHRKSIEQLSKDSKEIIPFDYNDYIDTITEDIESPVVTPYPAKDYLTVSRVKKAMAGSIGEGGFHQVWKELRFWWISKPRTVSWVYWYASSLSSPYVIQIWDFALEDENSYNHKYRIDIDVDWTVNLVREVDSANTQIWTLLVWYNIISISYKPWLLCIYINWKPAWKYNNPETDLIHSTYQANIFSSPYFLFTLKEENKFQEEVDYKNNSTYYKYVNRLTGDIIS